MNRMLWAGCALAAPMVLAGAAQAQSAPPSCERMARAALPNARIDSAVLTPAGPFVPPGGAGGAARPLDLPAFCRVALTLTPTPDSDIKAEVWLPAAGWNGKFMMVGNGAWAGTVAYGNMAAPLARGYAVASTDTGHRGGAADFAVGHKARWIDYGWRAVHETAVAGKAATAAFYGGPPRLSYWNGCSTGGKQGLKEVQAFPADFDGVIAGAPAHDWSRLQTRSLWMSVLNMPAEGRTLLDAADYALLHKAAIAACDKLDGVEDGEIADPRRCDFRAASLACLSAGATACLSPAQVEVADRIYAGPRSPKTRALIYPGPSIGSEGAWAAVANRAWALGQDQYRYYVYGDPAWNWRTLDLDTDVAKMTAFDAGANDATSADLSAFRQRGGKLIHYHGWSDPLISADGSVNYYERVAAGAGGLDATRDFYRLFMIPSMGHCTGGYSVDWITALEDWVEKGRAPDTVIGQRALPAEPGHSAPPSPGARPICAYPMVMRYRGQGSPETPASWTCAAAARGPAQGHAS